MRLSGRGPSAGHAQFAEEPGRLLLTVAGRDRGHHQPLPGPGRRDIEQSPFLGQQRGGLPYRGQLAAGQHVDQLLRTEDTAPQPQIGPDALLHPWDHHQIPLQPLGRVRGQHPDRGPRSAVAARVSAGNC